jgi:hypothetical protein
VHESLATLYVDDAIALSTRMYNFSGEQLGFYVQHGEATFENVRLSAAHPALTQPT